MPRKHRIHFPGALYHVINRGNRKSKIFLADDDYRYFLDSLETACGRCHFRLHAYCLMPNHFHLILEVGTVPLSTIMRSHSTRFARYFNRTYRKVGHVFQGRYRAILCQKDEYLLELIRYIHMNPVRAGLVRTPPQWKWSSHRTYMGRATTPLVHTSEIMSHFKKTGRVGFEAFIRDRDAITLAQNQFYPGERFPALGGKTFLKELPHSKEPRRRKMLDGVKRLSIAQVSDQICAKRNMDSSELSSRLRNRVLSAVRSEVAYAAVRFCGISQSKVAEFFQMSPPGVTRCYQRFQNQVSRNRKLEQPLLALLS